MTDFAPFRSEPARARYLSLYDAEAAKWPAPAVERDIVTSFGATRVRSSGPETGPTLALLPGVGSSSLMWSPNVAALSAEHRVHAIDNINDHGRSVRSRPIRKSADFSSWLDELLEVLSPGQPIDLIGISYGAWIAGRYALHSPARVGRLALIAPAGTVVNLSLGFIGRAVMCALPFRRFSRSLLRWMAEDTLHSGPEGVATIERMAEQGFVASRTFKPVRTVPPDLLSDEELASLPERTLFMVGENEKVFSAQDALARMQRAAPAIERQVIADAGHDLTLVRAQEVNRVLMEFLGRPP